MIGRKQWTCGKFVDTSKLMLCANCHSRKGEVELLLRRPINSDEDIQFTLAASEAGLIFMDEVHALVARGTSLAYVLSVAISPLIIVLI